MAKHLLYSTNCFLKLLIQERFRGDRHYVWCSECFDSRKLPGYIGAAVAAPSSDPCNLYKRLKEEYSKDAHSEKIREQKLSFKALAISWNTAGEITNDEMQEIVYLTDHSSSEVWRPLVYVIPSEPVKGRIQAVPGHKRASIAMEYVIPDLGRHEFDILEL